MEESILLKSLGRPNFATLERTVIPVRDHLSNHVCKLKFYLSSFSGLKRIVKIFVNIYLVSPDSSDRSPIDAFRGRPY